MNDQNVNQRENLSQREFNFRITELLVELVECDRQTVDILNGIVKEIRTLQEKVDTKH